MNLFARETPRQHLSVANDINAADQPPAVYPYSDLQAMAEVRQILAHFDNETRARIVDDSVVHHDIKMTGEQL